MLYESQILVVCDFVAVDYVSEPIHMLEFQIPIFFEQIDWFRMNAKVGVE